MVTAMLPDSEIAARVHAGELGIDPFDLDRLQPASYDLTLGADFLVARRGVATVDTSDIPDGLTEPVHLDPGEPFVLHPGGFALGSTVETVQIPDNLQAYVDGKSSLGRVGLMIHVTAGVVDAGFCGQVTLELFNAAPWQLLLRPGQRIGQIRFSPLTGRVMRPYGHPDLGSKYQGQRGVTPATGRR